ncbi:armadillo-type protein [Blastocladiella britannica]|nr:armadillo-type protein [Blastocladiella britannica]
MAAINDNQHGAMLLRLREANLAPPSGRPPAGPLDATMKKNLTFVKKLRLVSADSPTTLVAELGKLKLDKYLHEATTSLLESLAPPRRLSPADLDAHLALISALHVRFRAPFTTHFISQLVATIMPLKEVADNPKDEALRLARCKPLLRLFADAYLCGLLHSADALGGASADPFSTSGPRTIGSVTTTTSGSAGASKAQAAADDAFMAVFRALLSDRANMSLAVALAKTHAPLLFSRIEPTVAQSDAPNEVAPDALAPLAVLSRLRDVMERYFGRLCELLLSEHRSTAALVRKAGEWIYERGVDAPDDMRDRLQDKQKRVAELLGHAQSLASSLDLAVPELTDAAESTSSGGGIIVVRPGEENGNAEAGGGGMWEDEAERRLFSSVPDLEALLPAAVFSASKTLREANARAMAALEARGDDDSDDDDDAADHASGASSAARLLGSAESADDSDAPLQTSNLLSRLRQIDSVEMADALAIEFCTINTRGAQRRLMTALLDVEDRPDLIPWYGRVLAVLRPLGMGELIAHEVEHVVRRHARSKRLARSGFSFAYRITWVRYLATLVKFEVARDAAALFCCKLMLENPHPANLETLCHLLETCGRFLMMRPESTARTTEMLERLTRASKRLTDMRLRVMVAHALVACQPVAPGGAYKHARKERPIEEEYLLYLLTGLSEVTLHDTVTQILMFDWANPENESLIVKRFTKLKRFGIDQLQHAACAVAEVSEYYPAVGVAVIDRLMEKVKIGLESNLFRENRDRIATISYLGHFCVIDQVSSKVIFSVLQLLLSVSERDEHIDYFRIHLVASLLGVCASKLPAAPLNAYLYIFHIYVANKAQPVPMDIEFVIKDMLATLLMFHTRESLPAAAKARMPLDEARTELAALLGVPSHAPPPPAPPVESPAASDLPTSDPAASLDSALDDEPEAEKAEVAPPPPVMSEEDSMEQLERELEALMGDPHSGAGGAGDDTPGPKRRTAAGPSIVSGLAAVPSSSAVLAAAKLTGAGSLVAGGGSGTGGGAGGSGGGGGLYIPGARQDVSKRSEVTLVTKRGAKAVVRSLAVPDSSAIGKHVAAVAAREEEERLKLKRLVLRSARNHAVDDD